MHAGKRAHTLVELVFACGLCALVMGSLLITQTQFGRGAAEVQGKSTGEQSTLQTQMRTLVKEIQEATRLFYPAPGREGTPIEQGVSGLGIVNSRGEAILYYLKPSEEPDKPGAIFRMNVNLRQSGAETNTAPCLENIAHFRVTVAPAAPGKEASLVNLDIGMQSQDVSLTAGSASSRIQSFVTAVFLRNLERRIPDDSSHLVPPP